MTLSRVMYMCGHVAAFRSESMLDSYGDPLVGLFEHMVGPLLGSLERRTLCCNKRPFSVLFVRDL